MIKEKSITIVDTRIGNIFNLTRALESINCKCVLTNNEKLIKKADRLLLPGVGAFQDGMNELKKNDLSKSIIEFSRSGKPLFGICLGMQLMMSFSTENGNHEGLNLIDGKVIRFDSPKNNVDLFKVPHIGWNTLIKTKDNRLFQNLDKEPFMYFLHSYYVIPKNEQIILSLTNYGKNKFCSTFQNENIFGCQFHPERSGKQGIKILENFLNL